MYPIFKAKEDPIFPGCHGESDICFADLDNNGSYNDGDYDLAIMAAGDPHCLKNMGEHFCEATFTSQVMSINASHPIP